MILIFKASQITMFKNVAQLFNIYFVVEYHNQTSQEILMMRKNYINLQVQSSKVKVIIFVYVKF